MTRRWSFLSQALGLMVDLDLGTEHLRWMGDTRFVLGFLKGVVSSTNFKARIRVNVAEDDKVTMARIARERSHVAPATMGAGRDPLNPGKKAHAHAKSKSTQIVKDEEVGKTNGHGENIAHGGEHKIDSPIAGNGEKGDSDDGPLPEAKPLEPTDSWLTIDSGAQKPKVKVRQDGTQGPPDSILYFYAGMMPWVSRDLNQWPVATVGQGVVDIVIQRVVGINPPIDRVPLMIRYQGGLWSMRYRALRMDRLIGSNLSIIGKRNRTLLIISIQRIKSSLPSVRTLAECRERIGADDRW
jgi:sphingosine kinase